VVAIAFKEFRRFTGSTAYMVNAGVGMILAALVGLLALVVGPDRIIAIVANGAPLDSSMLQPAIPFIVYFCIGMLATTACSPSLEGKNYWIVQSLPIEKKTLYQGKMLFNLALTAPFMAFSTVCLCLSARVPVLDTFMYLLLGLALCAFSTAWGCVCGIRHMRLDWENEIEVIKQGAAVAIYLLPNMFAVMGLTVLAVVLGLRMDRRLLALLFTLAAVLLAALSYRRVMKLSGRG
jgi:ABC-2 type transport system permease protein